MSRAAGQNSLTSKGEQNLLTPSGINNLNFRLTRDQVVFLKTAANLSASRLKANYFFAVFSTFELGGITKHLMTGPVGNSEFCFPSTSMFPSASPWETPTVSKKQNSLLPLGPIIKCLIY